MLYLYDKALTDKLRKFYPRVVYAPVDVFYLRYLEDVNHKKGEVKLPAISIWRVSQEFNPYNARSLLNTPANLIKRQDKDTLEAIYSMQVPLTYQMDIWASTDIDRDDMFQELMYALTLYPDVVINYRGQRIAFPLQIETPDDVTEINEFESTGELYRYSVPMTINSARLFFYQETGKVTRFINTDLGNSDIGEIKSSVSVTDEDWEKFIKGGLAQ